MSELDLNAPEVQDAIKKAVEEATTGLKNKNNELIGELRKAKKDSVIDPEDYNRLKDERDSLQDKLNDSSKLIKQMQSDGEKIKKSFEQESGYVQKLLIDNGLTTALNESGVKDPVLLKAAKAMFAGQSQIKIDGDNRIAMIGEKPINDYIKEWSATEEGKYFVAAPQNNGGGALGGATGQQTQNLTSAQKIAAGLKEIYKT
jgi:hypothetical protein